MRATARLYGLGFRRTGFRQLFWRSHDGAHRPPIGAVNGDESPFPPANGDLRSRPTIIHIEVSALEMMGSNRYLLLGQGHTEQASASKGFPPIGMDEQLSVIRGELHENGVGIPNRQDLSPFIAGDIEKMNGMITRMLRGEISVFSPSSGFGEVG